MIVCCSLPHERMKIFGSLISIDHVINVELLLEILSLGFY